MLDLPRDRLAGRPHLAESDAGRSDPTSSHGLAPRRPGAGIDMVLEPARAAARGIGTSIGLGFRILHGIGAEGRTEGGLVRRACEALVKAGHDIEAEAPYATRRRGSGGQPGRGSSAQATLLARVDRFGWAAHLERAPGLHLDEDQQDSAPSDQVDLDPVGAHVPADDAIPSTLQELRGDGLALATELGPIGRTRAR